MKYKVVFKLENYVYIFDIFCVLLDYFVSVLVDYDRFYCMKLEMFDSIKFVYIFCSYVGENFFNIL